MAVKAVNNTTSSDGLIPTLLVYRAYLRMGKLDPPAPSITDRAAATRKAMAEIVKLRAKQTVNNALHHCNGPNIALVYNLLLNSEVLVQRESGNQTRPYHLLAVKNKIYYIQLPSRLTSFRSISIKPYFWSKNTHNIKLNRLQNYNYYLVIRQITSIDFIIALTYLKNYEKDINLEIQDTDINLINTK